MSEAKASLRCLRKMLWLRRYEGSARPGSDGVAVELGPPVEEGAAFHGGQGAHLGRLGCTGGNNVVPLGGHHGNRQALLDGSAASSVAVQAVGDGGYDLVGAFRGSGKKASGHDTFSVVSGWSSLTPTCLGVVGSCLLGLVP